MGMALHTGHGDYTGTAVGMAGTGTRDSMHTGHGTAASQSIPYSNRQMLSAAPMHVSHALWHSQDARTHSIANVGTWPRRQPQERA